MAPREAKGAAAHGAEGSNDSHARETVSEKRPGNFYKVIFASCEEMIELADESVHLMVTSPPYFNAPFDYHNVFPDYQSYLRLIRNFAKETFRVLQKGRIAVVNCDDMLVEGEKYPIVADVTRIFLDSGFRYRDKIIWKKPEGYIRISRRSGLVLQHPYPMYFYPDNLQESILIFQKGKYKYPPPDAESRIDRDEYLSQKWFLSVWEMTNQLPTGKEGYPAAFPPELPYRIIKLFSNVGEIVLDPFLGSGTTMKVAMETKRSCIGYEIDPSLRPIIESKLAPASSDANAVEFVCRETPEGCPRDNSPYDG